MTDEAAWRVPAMPDDLRAAASHLITACEPDASEQRAAVLTSMLCSRDWTRAELLLAMQEVPFRNHYGRAFRLDVMAEVINESRERRALLTRKITEAQLLDLCTDPDVEPSHFACAGFDSHNKPLYRYAPDTAPHKHNPAPTTEEAGGRNDAPIPTPSEELLWEHAPTLLALDTVLVDKLARRMKAGEDGAMVAADLRMEGEWKTRRHIEAAKKRNEVPA